MMKIFLPLIIAYIFSITKIYCQCLIVESDINDCLMSDLEITYGSCGSNEFYIDMTSPFIESIIICEFNSVLNNPSYFAFIADGSDFFSVIISPIPGSCLYPGAEGIQGFLVGETDCTGSNPLSVCDGACFHEPFVLKTTSVPDSGQIIVVLIDGCNGAVCDVNLEILSGWTNSPVEPDEDVIKQSTILFEGNENCSNYTLNVEPRFEGICNYLWTLPDGSTRTSNQNSIDINMNGIPDGLVCVQGFSESCYPGELFPSENSLCYSYTARDYTNIEMGSEPSSCGEANGDAFVVVNGEGSFEFLWNNAMTDSSLVELEGGLYIVTVTDEFGCLYMDTAYVDTSFAVSSEIEIIKPDCMELLGGITISSSGGSGAFGYNWLPNVSSTNIALDIEAGQYMVTVTDIDNVSCSEELTIDLTSKDDLEVEIVEIYHSDMFVNNGFISFMVEEDEEFEYKLTSDFGILEGSDTIINNLSPGNYILEVIHSSGEKCNFVYEFMIKGFNRPVPSVSIRWHHVIVFPNPVNDILYIEGIDDTCSYELYNLSGELLLKSELINNSINLEIYPRGIYFLKIISDSGGSSVKKIVKI